MEGQVLGNRYELLEKVGGGGMAVVYKAKCKLLNRFVAIKILRPDFTNDEEFVKRFRVEAQAAASLSHPNIVSIYDVGFEDNIYYIVMEYIDGITLKEYISQKGALGWKEAVNIAIQICSAIEHAHRNNIVHRDIKPHNILLTKDGIAKVTDFGIARAVTSSTITMVGSTIGSVHYFSPEQARGGYTDEKSDLYSLGIALYEMVTGKVPFDGETPVAVALKHIQEEAEPPVMLNGNVPSGVNDIIMKAMKKDQNMRYQTAASMLEDLYRALKEPNGKFVTQEHVEECPTRRIPSINSEILTPKEGSGMKEEENKKEKKKNDKLTVWLAIATSVVLIGIFAFIAFKIISPPVKPAAQDFVVDNYIGKNINEVKQILNSAEIKYNEKRVFTDTDAKDTIIGQDVEQGKKLKRGGFGVINLTVSDGPDLVTLPNYKTKDYRDVEGKLKELGLESTIEREFDDSVATDLVTRTDPAANSQVKVGSTVTVYVSKGPQIKTTKVPNIIGYDMATAQSALLGAKLRVGTITPEGNNLKTKVIKQVPEANTVVNEETAVDIYFETSTDPTTNPGTTTGKRVVNEVVNLEQGKNYGSKVRVLIKLTPSDTNKTETVFDGMKDKSEFPLPVQVPIPDKGKTKLYVELDGKAVIDKSYE